MAASFEFSIVTPNGKKYSAKSDLLTIKTSSGALGVMKNHAPLEAIIEISELIVHNGQEIYSIALGGGILHINKEGVTILADSFETKDEIDLKRAQDAKTRAEHRLASTEENVDIKRAEIALKKALNRISIVSR